MKNSVFLVLCVLVVLTIAAPSFMIPLIALALLAFLFYKNKKQEDNFSISFSDETDSRLPRPNEDYSYYEIVGMRYRNLKKIDFGIHNCAIAVAERHNPYDAFAVGIYRTDNGDNKLVGYVPKGQNVELHRYIIDKYNGQTMATYKIWKRDDKIYGIAYIKDDGL